MVNSSSPQFLDKLHTYQLKLLYRDAKKLLEQQPAELPSTKDFTVDDLRDGVYSILKTKFKGQFGYNVTSLPKMMATDATQERYSSQNFCCLLQQGEEKLLEAHVTSNLLSPTIRSDEKAWVKEQALPHLLEQARDIYHNATQSWKMNAYQKQYLHPTDTLKNAYQFDGVILYRTIQRLKKRPRYIPYLSSIFGRQESQTLEPTTEAQWEYVEDKDVPLHCLISYIGVYYEIPSPLKIAKQGLLNDMITQIPTETKLPESTEPSIRILETLLRSYAETLFSKQFGHAHTIPPSENIGNFKSVSKLGYIEGVQDFDKYLRELIDNELARTLKLPEWMTENLSSKLMSITKTLLTQNSPNKWSQGTLDDVYTSSFQTESYRVVMKLPRPEPPHGIPTLENLSAILERFCKKEFEEHYGYKFNGTSTVPYDLQIDTSVQPVIDLFEVPNRNSSLLPNIIGNVLPHVNPSNIPKETIIEDLMDQLSAFLSTDSTSSDPGWQVVPFQAEYDSAEGESFASRAIIAFYNVDYSTSEKEKGSRNHTLCDEYQTYGEGYALAILQCIASMSTTG
ncbi:hypothetical protein Clacol_005887 [Clathrus columnatus]|uniref:Uncharacterized protein n=1 Tax=Clathrus columnatus TaxID=1419009 RepID=A0AAV5AF98_9AGAM|nr:hypothetical protein Clacol_005887 [Clathrus columnatus]